MWGAADEDVPVSGTLFGADPQNEDLRFAIAAGPADGTLSLDAETGEFTYTPYRRYLRI